MNPAELRMLTKPGTSVPDERNGPLSSNVGREFTLDPGWDRLRALEENRKRLDRIIGQFKAMGELLEPVAIEVEEATTKEDKENK